MLADLVETWRSFETTLAQDEATLARWESMGAANAWRAEQVLRFRVKRKRALRDRIRALRALLAAGDESDL